MNQPAFIDCQPPYYAVVFTSVRAAGYGPDYDKTAERMQELAREQPGFLGLESVRGTDGLGITVSYWESEAAIAAWREHAEHQLAQASGRGGWYSRYELRVCRVERVYGFIAERPSTGAEPVEG